MNYSFITLGKRQILRFFHLHWLFAVFKATSSLKGFGKGLFEANSIDLFLFFFIRTTNNKTVFDCLRSVLGECIHIFISMFIKGFPLAIWIISEEYFARIFRYTPSWNFELLNGVLKMQFRLLVSLIVLDNLQWNILPCTWITCWVTHPIGFTVYRKRKMNKLMLWYTSI